MTVNVVMPALGESVTEGTITRWLKSPGERVAKGEPLIEVATDKVDTEVEAPASGVLASIDAPENSTVAVGTLIGTIADGEVSPNDHSLPASHPSPVGHSLPIHQPPSRPSGGRSGRSFLSPAVRALVRDHGLDVASIVGTGHDGRVTIRDARIAAEASESTLSPIRPPESLDPVVPAAPGSAASGKTTPMSRLRQTIARRMVESLRVAAQLTSVVEVDMTAIAHERRRLREADPDAVSAPSFLAFVARGACDALRVHPVLNCTIDADGVTVTYHDAVHLGIAVDTERGLVVPVIQHAGDLTVAGLTRRIADVAERTRESTITVDELSGGTFTITNTGSRGALFDTSIINQPQVGILGFGAVVRRPVVVVGADGEDVIAMRSMAHLALTYDHRLVDGAEAARFLGTLRSTLENLHPLANGKE